MCTLNELPTSYIFLPSSHDIQGRPEGMDIPLQFCLFQNLGCKYGRVPESISCPSCYLPTEFELCI